MRYNIFITLSLIAICVFVYMAIPTFAQLVDPVDQFVQTDNMVSKIIAPTEFQKIDPLTKDIKQTYSTEELILLELKSINEKLDNIQRNTFKR
jgi:hypothetical protein